MKHSRIREWEENNSLINFNWALIRKKKQEKLKTQGRDASYKFKKQTCRNSQEHPTLYGNGTIMSKVVGKLRIKEFSENLYITQIIQNR